MILQWLASMLREGMVNAGVTDLAHTAPARGHRPAAIDRRLIASNIELPLYVREGVEAYMVAHEDTTFRTVIMEGLRALGIQIEDEDLVPERAMRRLRRREAKPGDTPDTLKPTNIRLPRYVRVRAEEYLLEHPEMRFRQLVMAGFKALGIEIKDEDLITERPNVMAEAPPALRSRTG